jgi:toxoflavin synthase
MHEFDKIAKGYLLSNFERPLFTYAIYPTFFEYLGDLNGLKALDLGCGEGIVSRELKKKGATEVVGIDSSIEMINLAKEIEENRKEGIIYQHRIVGNLGKIGSFEVISGAFILHYSSSKKELEDMCFDCYNNLSENGTFLAINNNPEHPLSNEIKYGNLISCINYLPNEGDKLIVTHPNANNIISFTNYYWRKNTYEDYLRNAGFKSIDWLPIKVSKEGYKNKGTEFWKEFLEEPFFVVIRCKK